MRLVLGTWGRACARVDSRAAVCVCVKANGGRRRSCGGCMYVGRRRAARVRFDLLTSLRGQIIRTVPLGGG